MSGNKYSFCASCDESIEIDDCFVVNNEHECPLCRNVLAPDSFDEIVESAAPVGLTY